MTELRSRMTARIGDSSGYINGAADIGDILEPEQLSIYQCCRNGDAVTLDRLLTDRRRQTTINDPDDNGLTALHYAARDKHFEVAKLLIEKGKAYAAAKDEDGATPLHYCARKRQKQHTEETVDLIHLLAYLTDVNVRDRYLCTPLHFAAMRGNDIAAQALLECKGIKVDAKDALGSTPLHEAAIYNDVQVAMMLIKYGADLGAVDNNGRTALHFAVMGEDNVKMIKVLLQNTRSDQVVNLINKKDKDHNTALHLAIDARNLPAVKILLNKGSHVNEPCRISSSGSSPLHLAAITGDIDVTELLLAKGARMYSLDLSGSTPLHKAVEYQNRMEVELLISKMRSSPNQKDGESYTPLLVAVCYPDADIVRTLLAAGSDVMAVDRQERNAIHLAAANNEKDIMKLLIEYVMEVEHYALLNEEDRNAETPLHIASRMGHLEIAQLLIESGVDLTLKNEDEETAFLLAAKTGDVKMVELFISKSEKVLNDQDEFSNSALHLAASGGHRAVVETLVRCGADKDMRNVRLDTPMDHACAAGRVSVVDFLLQEEVSPNDDDDEKDTPLLLAAGNGHEDVVSVLIEKGAHVTACDKRGRNCLSLAIDKGNRDVAKAIIQSSKWRQALLQELNLHNRVRDTPMRKLIRNMPDVAQLVLNRLITSSPDDVHPNDPNFWYHFDFTFIDDTYFDYDPITMKNMEGVDEKEYDRLKVFDNSPSYADNKLYLLENHPIMVMVDKKRDNLLSHPLVVALIRHKWNACRPAYFGYMLFYAIFLVIMSAFMVVSKAPYSSEGQCNSSGGTVQGSFEKGSTYFIIVFAALGVISEIVQMITQLRLYMVQPMNLLDWFTYISAILVAINLTPCGARTAWQWQLGAFSMFATWMNFLLLLRRLPVIGIYAVMIQDILKTFCKFLGVFLLFLVAFSLTFFTLFRDQDAFKDPGQTIVKTWSMMLGEFNYDELFYAEDTPVPYLSVSYIFFVVFLIVMAIVVVNLMTGLAIDDVNELQSHARLRKLAIQMELAIAMEVAMPKNLRRAINYTVAGLALYPNEYENSISIFMSKVIDGAILNKRKIVENVRELEGEEQSEISLLEQKLDRFVSTRKSDMQKLNSRLDKLESMIEGLTAFQSSGRRKRRGVQRLSQSVEVL